MLAVPLTRLFSFGPAPLTRLFSFVPPLETLSFAFRLALSEVEEERWLGASSPWEASV